MVPSIGPDGPSDAPAAAAPPEPEEFSAFHSRVFKLAQDALRDYDKRKLSKHLLNQERLSQAHRAIHRGEETRRFLESEFWREFLKPMLGAEQDMKPWKPGDAVTLEKVAIDHLFASGKAAFLTVILSRFEDWIRVADDAKKIVAEDAERRKQIKEMGA